MTLPSSGSISLSEINTEFSLGTNIGAYRSATWYTDAGGTGTFPSTDLSMSAFYGKRATSPLFAATISTNQQNLNLRTWAINNGWNGSSAAQITISSTVYITSTSTGTSALTVDGSWPGGLTLINDGYIIGRGGNGGTGGIPKSSIAATAGGAGGTALSCGTGFSITNNGTIGGGGGGGGGGAVYSGSNSTTPGGGGGGGAGGGAGGLTNGSSGTTTAAGSGGTNTSVGGAGGSLGSVGTTGGNYTYFYFSLVVTAYGGAGGAAGYAVSLNGNTVTWNAYGTRYGTIG